MTAVDVGPVALLLPDPRAGRQRRPRPAASPEVGSRSVHVRTATRWAPAA